MNPRFYHRMEADYLEKVEIWWLKKYDYLSGWKIGGIKWKHGSSGDENSIGVEVSLVGNLRKYYSGEPPGNPYVRFSYSQADSNTGEKRSLDYKVSLVTTPCNFGGWRYWFECLFCQRRVGVLYLRGSYFACRHCQYLTYASRNLSGRWKWAGKIISIPELDALRKEVKRISYNGRPTRKLKRFLFKEHKARLAFRRNAGFITKMILKDE